MRHRGISQGDLRRQNELLILEFVRENPGRTQVEIAKGIELTRAAVSKLIGPDIAIGPKAGLRVVLNIQGERPSRISLRTGASCVLAVDIGVHHVRGRCCDLLENVIAEHTKESCESLAENSQAALDMATEVIETVLEQAKNKLSGERGESVENIPLAGIVIGVPYPVDSDGVVIADGEWRYVQLPSDLWQRLKWSIPADVLLDAHMGAIAELDAALADDAGLKGLERNTMVMIYLKWSSSLTGAVAVDGVLLRGFRGMAGSIAHAPLHGQQSESLPVCDRCGRVCVNSMASLKGIVARLGVPGSTFGDDAEKRAAALVARARRGDGEIQTALADAARAVGCALGAAINAINPRLVIVGGAFHSADYTYLSRYVHEGVEQTAIPQMQAGVLIQSGRRTGEAALAGGISHALRQFAAPHLLEKTRPAEQPSLQIEGDD